MISEPIQSDDALTLTKGTAVVSLADGAKLGVIDRLYLDPERKAIVAFSFHQGGGLFSAKSVGMVDVADVHAIGPDAVTIGDATVIHCEMAVGDQVENLVDLDDLRKRTVITDGGVVLGEVAAVRFGEDSFRLTELDVSPGALREHVFVPATAISLIGEDMIVVADPEPIPFSTAVLAAS